MSTLRWPVAGPDRSAPRGLVMARIAPLLLLALSATACEPKLPEPTAEERAQVTEVAAPAAGALLRTLVGRLTGAMEEGGAVPALEFCATEAIPLTLEARAGLEGGLSLKRTSFRYRNPDNAPDRWEEEALHYFEEAILAMGEAPPGWVQRVSEEEFRYYQPLFMGELCLQCHGDPGAMDPRIVGLLEERYPGDLATGYRAGDFRGVVQVSVPRVLVGR